jgi:hypothetical protein
VFASDVVIVSRVAPQGVVPGIPFPPEASEEEQKKALLRVFANADADADDADADAAAATSIFLPPPPPPPPCCDPEEAALTKPLTAEEFWSLGLLAMPSEATAGGHSERTWP